MFRPHHTRCLLLKIGIAAIALATLQTTIAQKVDFERDVQPILEENCLHCHGGDEQESGFRVDSRLALLKGGDYGEPGIVPGDTSKGLMIGAIEHTEEGLEMPLDGKLSDESIAIIKRWVEQGAVWPGQMDEKVTREKSDHWAFQPVTRPAIPRTNPVGNPRPSSEIDAFLHAKLAENQISMSPQASPRTLIRRASIILTGLPPTPQQVAEFESDHRQAPDQAYRQLVEHLLASPHFGERWAQHWLDIIRWAETNGSESNMYRKNAWVYRDYVVDAFNSDKPYDQFIREQLAGDTLGVGEATGFLVAGPHVPAATVGREPVAQRQARADRMDEVMQTLGASMMGVTIGCARCHNHKFDPISIQDYYSMTAAFQDVEFGSRYPESHDDPRQKVAQELTELLEQQRKILRKTGPWVESSVGFDELHFAPQTTTAIRIEFSRPKLRIDEIEFFSKEHGDQNLVHKNNNVEVTQNEQLALIKELRAVNDGEYGTMAWIVKAEKNSANRPWLEFSFDRPYSVDRMRISTNREDNFETDYLKGLSPKSYGHYTIKLKAEDGQWKQIANTSNIAKKLKKSPPRAQALAKIQKLIDQLALQGPQPGFFGRFIQPVDTFVLRRGSPENLGDPVSPSGLEELGGDLGITPDAAGHQRRAAFAQWLARKENPLTARVMVNRIWHHVFGQGIVGTTSDFGKAGMLPTHPELLDWLASEFVEPAGDDTAAELPRPWSMKHIIRKMVMSDAFRQSSNPREDCADVDAGSALLWRYPPKRMDAEVIRDSIIQASGSMDDTVGGRSYRIHNVKKRYAQWEVVDNYSEKTWRRLIYQERMRRVDDRNFTAFDFPDCGQVRAKRPVSTTPLQALNLMNSDFVVDQSRRLADRATQDAANDLKGAVVRCFELLLNRSPSADELEPCLEIAQEEGLQIVCRALINSNEFAFLP